MVAGQKVPAGCGESTLHACMDFETHSEAGYDWDADKNKWVSITKSPPHGLGAVGAPVYSEHASCEVLSLAYDLRDGLGPRLWIPGAPDPIDLFLHIATGKIIEARNASFEYYIWTNVCTKRMNWPAIESEQLLDTMATSRAWSIPASLEKSADALHLPTLKDKNGKRLITKFSKPRNPTKNNPKLRNYTKDHFTDAVKLYDYNIQDIIVDMAVSEKCPDLNAYEQEVYQLDRKINLRGCHIDKKALEDCICTVEHAFDKYTKELQFITGGKVQSVGELKNIMTWLKSLGFHTDSLNAESVQKHLAIFNSEGIKPPMYHEHPEIKRVFEIREILGSASVKKLFAISRKTPKDGRIKELFAYYGAATGRFAGRGPQPQNLPNSGPEVKECDDCGTFCKKDVIQCPVCDGIMFLKDSEWGVEAVESALDTISHRDLKLVEDTLGDPISAVAGCLRGLFCAAPGHELICSDYSAIEAVVLAFMAGEQWRMDVFNDHGMIYEMSASKILGIPFSDFVEHKERTGNHHPMRKKLGKVAELASGYQGGYGAWCKFKADKHLSETEIRSSIKAWRTASPMIVKFWYGLEDAAKNAIKYPGKTFSYREVVYGVKDKVLYCRLPSGRLLSYHEPILIPDVTSWGKKVEKITFMGFDSVIKKWCRQDTYGGKLTENVVQAVARDILVHAMVKLEKAGYPVVLHVHDEIVSEVKSGFGTVEEFEKIMGDLPEWCKDWPVKAAGGWRGKRYRKD